MNALYLRLTVYPKPTVGALNGHSFAGGLFLAAHLDFRLMCEDRGWICLPEVDINIPLLPGMIAICEAVMPSHGFRQLYYTGKRFGGPDALRLGFADALCSEAELLLAAVNLAAELGAKRKDTYAEMKGRLRAPAVHALQVEDPKALFETLSLALSAPG